MENKTCEDCKSFPGMGYYCPIIGRFCDPNNEKPCEFFEKPIGRIATNGDVIRQMSNEKLLDALKNLHQLFCGISTKPLHGSTLRQKVNLTMKIENDKIIQATEDELYSYWLTRGWDDIYSFPEYMQRMKDAGCEVIAEIPQTLFDRITASPEVLAEKLVYYLPGVGWYFSTLFDGDTCWKTKAEAIAATVEKLKEVEK